MLFFKALFITSLLIFGSVQCSLQPDVKRLFDVQRTYLRREKEPTTSELLSELVRNHVDHKYSVNGLHLPEIKAMLKGAGDYVVVQLDIAEDETKKLMKDIEGVSATLFGHREGSASDLNIENAARFFLISLGFSIIRMTLKSALSLFKSSLTRLF
ncbi:hypothetical protein INT48_002928 [Thamnidium elegans]|uniref:Uncharacterized protein n=1 Tax=Thamnidium elegans TaxID=101142 RepID=A0A8H7VY78_9FUNG|nr:hypothetical protein INT48_002928 [Thamnidium elegans]